MTSYPEQKAALLAAVAFIETLPEGTVWALSVTDEDVGQDTSSLNIFTPKANWEALSRTLPVSTEHYSSPGTFDGEYLSYKVGTLLISFIE